MDINFHGDARPFGQVEPGSFFIANGFEVAQLFFRLAPGIESYGAVCFSEATSSDTKLPSIALEQGFEGESCLVLSKAIVTPIITLATTKASGRALGSLIITEKCVGLRCARKDRYVNVDLKTGEILKSADAGSFWIDRWAIHQSLEDFNSGRPAIYESSL